MNLMGSVITYISIKRNFKLEIEKHDNVSETNANRIKN